MKRKANFFVAFEKIEKQEDGTMLVSGVASSEAVDSDGEVITTEAMKAALPDYMKFGTVREMHQPIAAGTALKCEVGDDGRTTIEAKIVDASTVLKIEEDVLKGFSVGGRVTSRDPLNKNTITGIKLMEISVVDRPSNPEALFVLGKVEGSDEATLGDLRKGMFEVERLADLLWSLLFLTWDVTNEAECEGDNSPVPAALRAGVAQLVEAFKSLAVEEVDELMAMLPAPPSVEAFQMAAKLAKGEKPSASMEDIRKALADATEQLAKLAPATDSTEKDAAIQKAVGLEEDLRKATATIDTLTKRVAELEALPAPTTAVTKGVVPVDKEAEAALNAANQASIQTELNKIEAIEDPAERALAKVKFIHRTGGSPAR